MKSQRIIIIGNGGAGKSTLAEKLGKDLDIPVAHLDLLSWKDKFERVPEDIFRRELSEKYKAEKMIIEGWAYHSTMHDRMLWADTVIYLKFPLQYCLNSVFNRNREFKNRSYPYDPFTCDREAHHELYRSAVEKVHFEYEPEVQIWLTGTDIKNKKVFIINSSEELNEQYDIIKERLIH
jgi:adenylate kinase family enzyme